jgi:cyclophilin family peptidyl-prolyl cis-trans isomerase
MKLISTLFIVALFTTTLGCSNAQPTADVLEGTSEQSAPATDTASAQEALVKIVTDYGTMTIKLYNETPLHRDNFLKLVKQGFYDSLIFHRVIRNFMIQGGDPESKKASATQPLGNGGPGYTIPAEIRPGLIHKKGAIAAARMGDAVNPSKASSGSQFYLVQGVVYPLEQLNNAEQQNGFKFTQQQKEAYSTVGGTPHLDNGYTVFGEVIEGLEVIDAIAAVTTAPGDRPVKDVRMKMILVRDFTPAK